MIDKRGVKNGGVKIVVGIFVLMGWIKIGLPFEFENPVTDSLFRILSFAFIFLILFLLFKQTKSAQSEIFKGIMNTALVLLTVLFTLGVLWNDVFRSSSHGWYTLEVCQNKSGIKILRQIRETSGSIHDFRDRLVLYEFDKNNRISINVNIECYDGPWKVWNMKRSKLERVNRLY